VVRTPDCGSGNPSSNLGSGTFFKWVFKKKNDKDQLNTKLGTIHVFRRQIPGHVSMHSWVVSKES
jgi:hypothetical protein